MTEPRQPPEPPRKFEPDCRRCERLAEYRDTVRVRFPDYHCAPVAPFGANNAELLIVGLAPGVHGANASGRPFTGDFAGVLLYRTLFKYGLSSAPQSAHRNDGLELINCRLTNAVKCVPPANKPVGAEVRNCRAFLLDELHQESYRLVLALGRIAHDAVLAAFGIKLSQHTFGHAAEHQLHDGLVLLDSYHCSRYNTQTRRLTESMFHDVFDRATALLAG